LSAFGDNAVYSVIMGILLQSVVSGRITLHEFGVRSAIYANCLFLPYFMFAPLLGWISDYYEKRNVLIAGNLAKAAGAAIGCLGILFDVNLLMFSYLIIGCGAAVYSPSKYGIIPELNSESELVKANAAIEMTTVVSILTGFMGGGLLIDHLRPAACFMILIIVYALAGACNQLMARSGIRNRDLPLAGAFPEFKHAMRTVLTSRKLYACVFGTVLLWASAAFIRLNLQTWGQSVLQLKTMTDIALLAFWLSIGIIIGSLLTGKIFKTGVIRNAWKFGLLMGVVVCVMVLWHCHQALVIGELVLIGILGGIFVIPLNAEIQACSDTRNIGKIISIQNCFENGAMLSSSGIFWGLNKLSFSPTVTFLIIGGVLCLANVLWLKPLLKKA